MRTLACCVLVLFTVACGASSIKPPVAPPTTAPPLVATMPPAPPTAPATAHPAPLPEGLLFVQSRFDGDGIQVLDTRQNGSPHKLPYGLPAPDWSTLYTVTYDGTRTELSARDPRTGAVQRATTLDGKYDFRWDGWNGRTDTGGLSPDGRWIVLTGGKEYRSDRPGTRSSFAVFGTDLARPPRIITLDGDYTFDALANDGTALYLIENLPADSATPTPASPASPRYRVVLVDLAQPVQAPVPIVDKSTQGAVMAGTRQVALAMPNGQWVFSLYLNPKQPFVHALNLSGRYAVCIFLPAVSAENAAQQQRWTLARSADGRRLFAANGATGTIAEIDTTGLSTLRTVTVQPDAPRTEHAVAVIAHWLVPPVGAKGELGPGGIAVTPDGGTLALTGSQGIMLIDTKTLTVRARVLPDQTVSSVAVSPDGARLYAVRMETGTITVLDLATGAVRGTLPGGHDVANILRAT